MARRFIAANLDILSYTTGAILTAAPLTMAARARAFQLGTTGEIIALRDKDNALGTRNCFRLVKGNANTCIAQTGGAAAAASGPSNLLFRSGQWHHCAARFASATSRIGYLDGHPGTAETTSLTPASIDSAVIGAALTATSSVINVFDGDIEEAAIWNVALDNAEIMALAMGAPPYKVRRSALVAYWPLGPSGGQLELDHWGVYPMTVTGAVNSAPSPFVRPKAKIYSFPIAAAGGFKAAFARNSNTVMNCRIA